MDRQRIYAIERFLKEQTHAHNAQMMTRAVNARSVQDSIRAMDKRPGYLDLIEELLNEVKRLQSPPKKDECP